MAYDIVTFDLDGTLVDTAPEIAEAVNRALESHGFERRPLVEITHLIGAGLHELMRRLLARIAAEDPQRAATLDPQAVLRTLDEHYAATTGTLGVPYDHAATSLDALKRSGVQLAVVTNKERRHAVRVLQANGLDGYFDLVIGGDTLPQKKPHPSVIRHVVDTLGGDISRTAHVGDSATDVLAARNAGVAAWAVPYGYNAGVPVAQSEPHRLFDDLRGVAEHVLAQRKAASPPTRVS